MSKEIELLKECRLMLDNPINGTAGRNLQIRITELLTQPEPSEDKFDRVKSNREFYQAGYAHAVRDLKREPLSESRIAAIWDDSDKTDVAITRAIEQQHGIGGGDNE